MSIFSCFSISSFVRSILLNTFGYYKAFPINYRSKLGHPDPLSPLVYLWISRLFSQVQERKPSAFFSLNRFLGTRVFLYACLEHAVNGRRSRDG